MTAITRRKKSMSLSDHLLREVTLLDYAISQIEQSRSFLTVIQQSCNMQFVSLSKWAIALASVQHQMEARSRSLSLMASQGSSVMGETPITCSEAYQLYYHLFGVKND